MTNSHHGARVGKVGLGVQDAAEEAGLRGWPGGQPYNPR
jgi:hypothetical protein